MIDHIKRTGATQSTQKSKKTKKTGNTSGVSFADLVNEATQTAETSATTAVNAVAPRSEDVLSGGYVPTEPKARGHYILDRLEELEQDILSGEPTAALNSLKEALATEAMGMEELPPRLQKLLDEVELRASVELAKLETDETV
jgi:hypothetical protein